MAIKENDILSYIDPPSDGIIGETALSFIKRYKNKDALMAQLRGLVHKGEFATCESLIQLILAGGEELSDSAELYLMQARIAYQSNEPTETVESWVKQAQMTLQGEATIQPWNQLLVGIKALKEGDYDNGVKLLEGLFDDDQVGVKARFEVAYHLFWRNINREGALILLEEIVKERPSFIRAWSCLGFVYNRLGEKHKAQEAFGHCIALDSHPERIKVYKQQIAS